MNLFESFDEIVNDEFIEKFKSYTSTTHGDLNVTVKGIFYTLLAGMLRKTYSDMSANMLYNQIQENAKRIDLPENLASIFSQPSVISKIEADGSKIISQVFPAYKSPLLSMVSTYSGVSKSTTSLGANIIANVLVVMFSKDIDKDQMVKILREHHEPLIKAIPESLLEKMIPSLGLHELLGSKPTPIKKVETPNAPKVKEETPAKAPVYPEMQKESSGAGIWVGILLGILILGGGTYWYYTQNGGFNFFSKKEVPVESVETPVEEEIAIEEPKVETTEVKVTPSPTKESEFSAFKKYILNKSEAAGKEFEFKSINFVTDSVTLHSTSVAVIDSIATLMKENSRLQVKITAFSASGDTPFNNKRAFAVKRVLTKNGIPAVRIDAVSGGKGGDSPKIKVITK
jgi:outer membrane protein OmpA-like peptidoglycan-associated protein